MILFTGRSPDRSHSFELFLWWCLIIKRFIQLLDNLFDGWLVAMRDHRHARKLRVMGRPDIQGVDVVPPAAEQPRYAGQNAKFILDQN